MSERDQDGAGIVVGVAKPEWLEEALPTAIHTLEMLAARKIPDALVGFMVRTTALRLLRCLYGSDLDTATAVRDHVIRSERMSSEMERKLAVR